MGFSEINIVTGVTSEQLTDAVLETRNYRDEAEADKVQTNADVVTTAANVATTNADVATTAANVALTNADVASSATNASNAATSASNASTSETNAGTSETNAAASALAAATSEANAATSESNASTSEANAASSETNALAAETFLKGVYLGAQASAPTTDLNGNPVNTGDLYFDTVWNLMFVRNTNNDEWISAGSTVNATTVRDTIVLSEGQTNITVNGGFDDGMIDVFLDGLKLTITEDYTLSAGTTIILNVGAEAGQELAYVAFGAFTSADHYTKAESDILHRRVPLKVKASENIIKGDVIMAESYNSGEDAINVLKTVNQTDIAIGVANIDMATGVFGDIITRGIIEGLDTSGYNFGDILYSAGTGGLTTIKPAGDYQAVGYVVKNHSINGTIMVDFTEPKSDTAGATGGGYDRVFYENDQEITTNYEITTGKNAMTAGDITIASGVTVTIPSGSRWTII